MKRAAAYAKRGDFFSEIPEFWMTAIENHPELNSHLHHIDLQILPHLLRIDVERKPEDPHYHRIVFTFDANECFANKQLVTEVFTMDGKTSVKSDSIDWLIDGEDQPESFFSCFSVPDDQDDIDDAWHMAHVIITDLHPNAMSWYEQDEFDAMMEDSDFDEEFEEESGEDDGEEEEMSDAGSEEGGEQ